MNNRRQFLAQTGLASLGVTVGRAQGSRPPRILLRSSWQTVNIGDIAHTPGVLRLLETHLPDAEVTLWPSLINNGVDELLKARFPKLRIAKRGSPDLKQAFKDCDFLLHGSGPSLVAQRDVIHWRKETGKPYGIYGITVAPKQSHKTDATSQAALKQTMETLSGARFVFFRDSKSLAFAKSQGCTAPVMEFGPDGAFACDLRNDAAAESFLAAQGLEEGKFLCCIPRLRYTPYWRIKDRPFDEVKHARNEAMKEHDHAQLRKAIEQVVQQTDLKVLLCPEDQTQMAVGKEMLLDPLPEAVRKRVAWRPNYWLTGEAISTYVRSAGLFGNEMHSPIMCIGNGVPAIVCRWGEQTSKGYMWEDIGLKDWLFNLDGEAQIPRIVPTVLAMAKDPEAARKKAEVAGEFVQKRQLETMAVLKRALVGL
ncbi:MAG: polysaccharide pyruvyl transferase WcaK-like protein [Rhodothermales bacterium]|jgi:polysaccharide pyruvyl transferase WcaK-like protein